MHTHANVERDKKDKRPPTMRGDGTGVRKWIEEKLNHADDSAIHNFLAGLPARDREQGYTQLRDLVERQSITLGTSIYRTQLVAIPILLHTTEDLVARGPITLDSNLLPRSLARFGLTRKSDGVVLLDFLVGSEYGEANSMSDLFRHSSQIFMSSVAGCAKATVPASPIVSVESCDSFFSVCYAIGVAYWKQGKEPPRFLTENLTSFGEWQIFAKQVISFSLMEHAKKFIIGVDVGKPQPFFSGFRNGRELGIEAVLASQCDDFISHGAKLEARIEIENEDWSINRHRINIELEPDTEGLPSSFMSLTTDETKGVSLTGVLGIVRKVLIDKGACIQQLCANSH